MKSMSPRKRYSKNKLNSSMGDMNFSSSQGFRTTLGKIQRRRNIGNPYRSLLTLQRAGPGSYNLPSLLGGFIAQTNKKNNPRYSIGKASKFEIKSMNKDQLKRSVGFESPGVGSYSPNHNRTREDSPNTKIGREKRFIQLKHTTTLKRDVPHAYLKKDSEGVGMRRNGRGFTKEKRFVIVSMKNKDKIDYPAPSQYNSHMHNTISSNFGTFSLGHRRSNTNISNQDKYHSKIYFKELERCYNNSGSPGPGAYNNHDKVSRLSYIRNSHHNSFTKVIYFISFNYSRSAFL